MTRTSFSSRALVIALALVAMLPSRSLRAQSSVAQSTTAQTGAADATAKDKLLASDQWKQIHADFQRWLGTQAIYRPDDIQRINANLAAQIDAMPAGEVQAFVDDWQARVEVLKGAEFQDAQDWLGQNLSVMADGFRRRSLKEAGLSDLAQMSAADLEEAFLRIRANRFASQQRQSSFDQGRQLRVQSAQQAHTAARQAQQQSRPSGQQRFATHESPYRPPKFDPPPPPRRQFFVTPGGRIMFDLPF